MTTRTANPRAGIALITTVMAITFLGLLSAAMYVLADTSSQSSRSRQQAARALQVAEAGLGHALSVGRTSLSTQSMTRLLIGSDNVAGTADDGLITGYGLASSDEIPATGVSFAGGTYFARIVDDPADTDGQPLVDSNNQVMVRCWSVLPDGSSAEVRAVIRTVTMPAIVVDGNLEISGKPTVTGACGSVHANGNITGGGEVSPGTMVTATGTVSVTANPKQSGVAPIPVPDYTAQGLCAAADVFINTNGWWKPKSADLQHDTTYCVRNASGGFTGTGGNVEFDGDIGTQAVPRRATVIASGTIKVPSKVWLKADHVDGFALMSGGDMDIQGDGGFEGIVYGGAQCYLSAKPRTVGSLICKNRSPHPGQNIVPFNLFSGDITVINNCGGSFGQPWRMMAWYPNLGT